MTLRKTIWLLKHNRAGDLAQMRAFAALLASDSAKDHGTNWIVTEKQLVFHSPKLLAAAPSAAPWLLDRKKSDSFDQPWPDAIIASERVVTTIAVGLKRRAGERTKIIVLGRPAGEITPFDLILTTAQYDLPAAPSVVHLPVPLATATLASAEERRELLQRMAGRPRPWIAALIGGSVPPDKLDKTSVTQIGRAVTSETRENGGSLIVLTSPRTGTKIDEEIQRSFHGADLMLRWMDQQKPNLYGAVLAEADRFVVTSDSISMVVETINTGKPVAVYMLPQEAPPGLRVRTALARSADGAASFSLLKSLLFRTGIIEAPVNRISFYRELIRLGVLSIYPDYPAQSGAGLCDDASALAVLAAKSLWP